jgi:hypothetical protein
MRNLATVKTCRKCGDLTNKDEFEAALDTCDGVTWAFATCDKCAGSHKDVVELSSGAKPEGVTHVG